MEARPLAFTDAGHGYDVFGMHPRAVATVEALLSVPYERYFRVRSTGHENLPSHGAAILVANHGGVLPLDAAMLYADVLRHTRPRRLARPVGALFIPRLPFVGTVLSRAGMVSGSRGNVEKLLSSGELIMIFPEGITGTAKTLHERYRLQEWRPGHAELAIRYRVPVIPVGIVGAEEAWPLAARIDRFHLFGAPYLPIPASPLPLPVRCHIRYGAPIRLHDAEDDPGAADQPELVQRAAERVRCAVERLVADGLHERGGVFR